MKFQLLVLFGTFFIGLGLRIPIVLALATSTIVYSLVYPVMPDVVLVLSIVTGLENPAFTAIPYYFLVGAIMNAGGMTNRLLRLANALLGWSRGGLAQVNIGASILFGGMSGSALADASAIGSIMIPAMKKDGYPAAYAAAVTASSASIGLLIPPSIPMVLYGMFSNASVGELFVAGIVPGLLMGLYLMFTSAVIASRRGYPAHRWSGLPEVLRALQACMLALALPLLVIVSLTLGIATASEVGAIAVVYAVLVSVLVYRDVSAGDLWRTLIESAQASCRVLAIIAVSGGTIWIIANMGATRELAVVLASWQLSPVMLLLVIASALVLAGTVVGPGFLMILIVPTLTPLASANGIDLIHFGVVCVLSISLSLLTPPVGILLYLTSAQANVSVLSVVRETMPFLLALLLLLLTVICVPDLSLGLGRMLQSAF